MSNLKKKIKKDTGITLIVLVITIIVLLILAGVAIAMLSGENGILKKAAEAKTKTEEGQKQEETTLNDMEIDSHFIVNGSKYKCKYGCITGIEFDNENGEVLNSVQHLENSLPEGYKVTLKYNSDTKKEEEITDKENTKITTGMAIEKDGKIVARTVIFGDVNRDGRFDTVDFSDIINDWSEFSAYQKVASDVNHDGVVDEKDRNIIYNWYIEVENDMNQYQSAYAQNPEDY